MKENKFIDNEVFQPKDEEEREKLEFFWNRCTPEDTDVNLSAKRLSGKYMRKNGNRLFSKRGHRKHFILLLLQLLLLCCSLLQETGFSVTIIQLV